MVCGDGEYIIYTAMALRNKSFGSAQEFVWASDSSEYVHVLYDETTVCKKNCKLPKGCKRIYFTKVHCTLDVSTAYM